LLKVQISSLQQGKGGKHISFISAYRAVQKGSDIGTDSLYAQQCTIHECRVITNNEIPSAKFCQCNNAMICLNTIIQTLQKQHHAIILMLDANQSSQECLKGSQIKQYSIEWLQLQRGMDDPFFQLMNFRPNSTTTTPGRDIEYILTYGTKPVNISTMGIIFLLYLTTLVLSLI